MIHDEEKQKKYINEVKKRCEFFQQVQVWPVNAKLNYEGWLKNFVTIEEKYIACHILTFFNHYNNEMIDKLLYDAVGKAGEYLSSQVADWQHSNFKKDCYYSFIPGENPNPTDSGYAFSTKVRNYLGVSQSKIIFFEQIPDKLKKTKNPIKIIFVDDFVGSGCQCVEAFTKKHFDNKSLEEIAISGGHKLIYTPLIANKIGYDRIKNECKSLHIVAPHILGAEYNMFRFDSIFWNQDLELFNAGMQLITSKSRQLGIPDNNSEVSLKGFGKQGLAISFEHGPPDAISALFFYKEKKWIPLVKRPYTRRA